MKKHLVVLSVLLLSASIHADDAMSHRPDGHAPIGVMGDHIHHKKEIMLSYRYMSMSMAGSRAGRDERTTAQVLESYMMAPVEMSMGMHMVGGMYAPSDDITLMAMVPVVSKEMDMQKRDLSTVTRKSSGIGDIKIGGLYRLMARQSDSILLNTAVSIPVGSIDEKDGQPNRLPYPMQLGSGTFDLNLGATYLKHLGLFSGGAQASGLFRLGENSNGYALGNVYSGSAWIAKVLTPSFSASLRSKATLWSDVQGADATLNPMMTPGAETDRGGKRLDISLGTNYMVQSGSLKGHRLAVEVGTPVFQSFDSVQLDTEWWLTLGWQYKL